MSNLYEELIEYSKDNVYPLHMPGHKRVPYKLDDNDILSDIYRLDITEISNFDNLHDANGVIKRAQDNAAKVYNSQNTFFLVNGSTAGILSAVSSIADRADTILIGRNSHKSVYNAAYINKLKIKYLYPEFDEEYDINGEILIDDIKKAIDENGPNNIAAILITSPTYDGVVSNIKEIAKIAHENNIPLIVDEAHGAHFGFNEYYPENSVKYADIVIHSVHKTLPSPTQTALIHVNSDLVELKKVTKYLKIYQTSSPSYLLMAGIDRCMDILKSEGKARLDRLYTYRKAIEDSINKLKHLRCCPYTEPGKLVISVKNTNKNGLWLLNTLRDNYKIEVEMAQGSYVLAILTMMDTQEGVNRLIGALEAIDKQLDKSEPISLSVKPYILKVGMDYCDAVDAPYEEVDICDASQRYVADFINLYPPGYPMAVPGEVLDERFISLVRYYIDNGYDIKGIREGKIKVIKWEN